MGDFNLALVIVAIVVCVLVLLFNIYLLVNYQHPDDVNQAYFPKFVVVIGLSVAAISILMLPADVANRQACRHAIYNGACNLTLPMKTLWLVVYIVDAVLVFFFIPFAMFYYEGDQDKSVGKRLKSALLWVLATAVVCALALGILYGLVGKVDFTVRHLSSSAKNFPNTWSEFSSNQPCIGASARQCDAYTAGASSETTWTMRATFPEYVVALATIVGSVLFTIFGGVGIACFPLGLIFSFIRRPKAVITRSQYIKEATELAKKARELKKAAEALHQEERSGAKGRKWRKNVKTIEKELLLLEDDMKALEEMYPQGEKAETTWALTVLGYLGKLILGILGLIVSVAWVAHIIIYSLIDPPRSSTGPVKSDRLTFNLRALDLSHKLQRRTATTKVPLRAGPTTVRAAAVEAAETAATAESLVDKSVNAIRFLAIDAVEKANSGHPGLPMGCAPMGHILFDEIMKYNPKHPYWFNRDRFVLSAGHGCMLHYALLHLAGYDSVKEEDLKAFRQWGSRTPGHPENFETPGIEVTTGPLGQGIANAVGLALAEKHLAARFNKPDNEIIDHYTYSILGDGCQMEGISNEACSLAGHWGLGKLIAFYDDNHISIDGDTEIAFTEDVVARFEALGWHTIWVKNGNTSYDEIRAAIKEAKAVKDKPTLIKVTTTIGYGSPNKANSYSVHGSALGAKEVDATRLSLGWAHEPFHVPEEVKSHWSRHVPDGAALEAEWNSKFAEYEKKYKEEAAEFKSIISGGLPVGWEKALPTYTTESPADATRNLSQQCLNALAKVLPGFLGGSADLASSNMTLLKMFGNFQKDTPEERNIRFGVREHGMGAICNGIALHSPGLIPYCATFFVFTDYMRAAMRIAALSEARVIYVMTHDSIGLGEDGPTHQPIEHLVSFRAMPNVLMLRPADGTETAGAYRVAVLNRKRPSVLALSRQKLPQLSGTSIEGVEKGGYIISDNSSANKLDIILMATGSELEIAAKAADELRKEGKAVRVVSFVSWELFEEQPEEYKESVLPSGVEARVSIEAGSTLGWAKYVGNKGKAIGIDRFGSSAPAERIYKEFGLTVENVIASAKAL